MLPQMLPVPWSASHRLTFTPADGAPPLRWEVRVVHDAVAGAEQLLAQTREEADRGRAPAWTCDVATGAWSWRDLVGPDGRSGDVELKQLSD